MKEDTQKKLDEICDIHVGHEQIAIGCMLQDTASAVLGSKILKSEYFVLQCNSYLFKLIQGKIQSGEDAGSIQLVINSITEDDWSKINPSDAMTRSSYVQSCMASSLMMFGGVVRAESLFNKIQEQYLRRKMIVEYQNSMDRILDTSSFIDLQKLIMDSSKKIGNILDKLFFTDAQETYKDMLKRVLNKKETTDITTGFSDLDELLKGFKAGQLITIGAATSVGKSAFAINLALNIMDKGHKVAIWSFEMDEEEIANRIFSIKTSYTQKENEERYNAARQYIDSTEDDIRIHTEGISDLGAFYLYCRKLSLQDGIKVIVIDYLQLIKLKNNFNFNRVREIEEITTTLKNIATELNLVIIVLSQLSRSPQKRDDKTPVLSDLRDSGSIEQDSNIVMFLHPVSPQPSHYGKNTKIIELIVAKNRSGQTGSARLQYRGDLTKFSNHTNNKIEKKNEK